MKDRRRVRERRTNERRGYTSTHAARQAERRNLRLVSWDEQRLQFLTRYVFAALGLAYYNIGEPVARSEEFLLAINSVHAAYFLFTTVFLLHAFRHVLSPLRWRLAMWTDILAVSFAAFGDANVTSPAYLVYLVIVLGNGMRYGSRAFAEAAIGGLLLGGSIVSLRFGDYVGAISVAGVFFILFVGIIVLYSYSLLVNIEKVRAQLEFASANDMLTGLLNRRGMYEKTDELFRVLGKNDRQVAILFTDLDGFKAVNDIHGHRVGDHVLKQVASTLRTAIRETDIAARFGGDEFVIIMPDTNLDQAASVAKRLQSAIASWTRQEPDIAVSLSIGMGEAPGHGHDLDSVLARVDNALYQSKNVAGKGGIHRVDGVAVA